MTNEEAIKNITLLIVGHRNALSNLLAKGFDDELNILRDEIEAFSMAIEALDNATKINKNGLLEVSVNSVEELDKINRVLVKVKDEAWCKFFLEEDWDD